MLAIGPLFFVGGLFIGLGLAAGLGAIFIVGLVLNAVLGFFRNHPRRDTGPGWQ